jgi:hypothetical protein
MVGPTRSERVVAARRRHRFAQAAEAAVRHGQPMTAGLSLTWAAIAAETDDAPILRRSERDRAAWLWGELRKTIRRYDAGPFLAGRAPEHDRRKGAHLHVALRVPDAAWRPVVALLERATGTGAEFIDVGGRSVPRPGARVRGVVAMSAGGGWMLQRNTRLHNGGTQDFLGYIAKSARPAAGQFRLSGDLIALTRTAPPEGMMGS